MNAPGMMDSFSRAIIIIGRVSLLLVSLQVIHIPITEVEGRIIIYYLFKQEQLDPHKATYSKCSNTFLNVPANKKLEWYGRKISSTLSKDILFYTLDAIRLARYTRVSAIIDVSPQVFQKTVDKNKHLWKNEASSKGMLYPLTTLKFEINERESCQRNEEIFRGYKITWKSGIHSMNNLVLCPSNNKNAIRNKTMIRQCVNSVWKPTNYSQCNDTKPNNTTVDNKYCLDHPNDGSQISDTNNEHLCFAFDKESETNLSQFVQSLNMTKELSDSSIDVFLNRAINIINRTLVDTENQLALNRTTSENLLTIINVVMKQYSSRLKGSQRESLRKTLNTVAMRYRYRPPKSDDINDIGFNFESESFHMLILPLSKLNNDKSVSFKIRDSVGLADSIKTFDPYSAVKSNSSATSVGEIKLPMKSIIEENNLMDSGPSTKTKSIPKLAIYLLNDASLFGPGQQPQSVVYSIVIQGIVKESTSYYQTLFKQSIIITLVFRDNSRYSVFGKSCVFWKEADDEWSTEGCETVVESHSQISCHCNHLSSFALMNMKGLEQEKQRLNIASLVGCTVSSICLLLTLLTYSCLKQIRSETSSKILMFICFNILMSNLLYMTNRMFTHYIIDVIDLTSTWSFESITCKSIAISLHYFLLGSLHWMTANGFYLYRSFSKGFVISRCGFVCLITFASCTPLLYVVPTAVENIETNYIHTQGICWLSPELNNLVFAIPVGILMLCNCTLFLLIFYSIRKSKSTTAKGLLPQVRGGITLSIMLGLTWCFAFLAKGPLRIAFAYLFVIFNSLQGFFIFIFYVLLKPKIRSQLCVSHCCRRCHPCCCCCCNKRSQRRREKSTRKTYEVTETAVVGGDVKVTEADVMNDRTSTLIW